MGSKSAKDDSGPRGGHIRVTWMRCPNRQCPSREFAYFDVDFEGDEFWCGTCERRLRKPVF